MPEAKFECDYCGNKFTHHIWSTEVAGMGITCPTCHTKMKEKNLEKSEQQGDYFGYSYNKDKK